MRIYKDSKTGMYHADYIEHGKRKRPSLHTKNKNVALLKSAKFLTPQKETYLNCSLETFEAKYFPFISSMLSANTVKRHKSALESLKAFSHIKTLEEVTPAMLADFQVHLLSEKKGKQDSISKENFMEWSKSIWRFPTVSAKKVGHPAPFPIELPKRLIEF